MKFDISVYVEYFNFFGYHDQRLLKGVGEHPISPVFI